MGGDGTDLATILRRALDEATRLLDAVGGVVFLADVTSRRLIVAAVAGPAEPAGQRSLRELVLAPGEGIVGRAVADGRAMVTGDYAADASFHHSPAADAVAGTLGVRSVAVAPMEVGSEPVGALALYSASRNAFGTDAVALVRILAEHAVTAVANRRLIDDLARARQELEGRASSERTIGEMAARLASVRDPDELLGQVVRSAGRLVGADGTILARHDRDGNLLRWGFDDGVGSRFDPAFVAGLTVGADVGPTGQAMAERRAVIRNRDLPAAFPRSPGLDQFFAATGYRSMIAAPIVGDQEVFGTLGVFSTREDAFDQGQADLISAFAAKAAIALANARLIDELGRAREAEARRAEAERTLHDISARVTALADPAEVLDEVASAARRLVGADFANIDLAEPTAGRLSWTAPPSALTRSPLAGLPGLDRPETLPGLWGLAVRTGRAVGTSDYVHDPAFIHEPAMDANAARLGIRAGAAVPLRFEGRILGVLQVATTRAASFDDEALGLLDALATDAASAIANSRWIAALDQSRAALARRVDIERTLREIGADISRLHDQAEVVQRAVDEAARLLSADGARVDVVDAGMNLLRGMYASGGRVPDETLWPDTPDEWLGMGVSGQAVVRAEPVWTGDYLADDRFPHASGADAFVGTMGIRSAIAAPLPGELGPLGALTAYSSRPDAFGPDEAATLAALAAQVAVSLTNARLIEDLARSREELARSVATERTLRQIAARITALTDLREVLASVVEEARRLLGSDGAHLTRMGEDGSHVYPVIIAGGMDEATTAWLRTQRFPVDGGINGLAAGRNVLTWTEDYRTDQRIPLQADDLEVAERMGLRAMAAAPLRAPGGGVIGTLAISYNRPRSFDPDELERLQGMADHAAIALANSLLFERLAESEARYRYLVQASPDAIWRTDAEGRFTFFSATVEQLLGYRPKDLLGRSWPRIVDETSLAEATAAWAQLAAAPGLVSRPMVVLRHADGSPVAAEISAVGIFQGGRFGGAHGAIRDVRERKRLERDLRRNAADLAASEERAHLARELHDSVTQALFSMGLVIRSIEMLLDRDPAAVGPRLAALRDLQRDALAETRSLVFELRPGSLAEEGLESALRTHVAGLVGRMGLPVILDLEAPGPLPPEIEETLYRIAQEALHNVVKHAGARDVRLELRRSAGEVVLSVVDDGVGFDPAQVGDEQLGLAGMRARAERAGGRLEVSSRPGGPTRVTVALPAEPSPA